MQHVSIIIPTYNEAKNLPILVEEIFTVLKKNGEIDAELIIVDDNSPDGTGNVAEELSRTYPVKVVHRLGKLGLGSAVREGFARSTRPILGVMDADLSHDPETLLTLIPSIEKYDVALGSRFEEGSTVEQWNEQNDRLCVHNRYAYQ
jgi:dolichol-phosphate mannosyltransferase